MTSDLRSVLLRQHQMAWKLTAMHLGELTTEDCLWRPGGEVGLHVWPDGEGRRWSADWPGSEGYEIGPASLGWITWHMLYWWRTVMDRSFGGAALAREDIDWPGTADGVRDEARRLHRLWVSAVEGLDDKALAGTALTRWPFEGRPFADVIAWVNIELMKTASEMGYVLFLKRGGT